jgi:aspartate 1-decarboxylase
MTIEILKSKIHHATVTQANLYYVGSITIDEDLMDAAGIVEYEKVSVVNINNGERFETYVIKGGRSTGVICVNGPAARKCCTGDVVVVMAYAQMSPEEARNFKPRIVFPNKLTNILPPQ